MGANKQTDASKVYQEILLKLQGLRKKENRERLLTGILFFVLGFIGLLLLGVVAEAALRLGVVARTILFWVLSAATIVGLVWVVGIPLLKLLGLLKSSDLSDLAGKVGDYFPSIKDRLLNLLQLHDEKGKARTPYGTAGLYSVDLIDAAFLDLRSDVTSLDFSEAATYRRPVRVGKALLVSTVVVLLIMITFPSSLFEAAGRLVHYDQEFASASPIRLVVQPGNAEVVRGEDVSLSVAVEGKAVDGVILRIRQEGEMNFSEAKLKKGPSGSFAYKINAIKNSTRYYAEAGGTRSDEYKITVLDRPAVKNLHLHLTYPSYTHISSTDLEDNTGDVTALTGTRVDVEVRANKELAKAALVYSDHTELPMKTVGEMASTHLALLKDRTYHILLGDRNGVQNIDPIEYQMTVLRDEDPTVSIVLPGKDVDLGNEMRLPLLMKIHDDFGFTKLRLAYKLVHSRYEQPSDQFSFVDIPLETNGPTGKLHTTDLDVSYDWDLRSLSLATEDVVSYYAEVYDNDVISGPKVGRSQSYTIRVPSLDEIFADVEKGHEETLEDLKNASNDAKELKNKLDEINEDLKKSRDQVNWEKQKNAEELLKKYEQLQKSVQETSRKLDEVVQQMEKNNVISPETMEKYLELQQLMEQINSPELREAMKKLQEALQNLNPDQLREALQKFTFSEEQFRQSLERTLSILKRIQIEQKLQEALRRTADLQQQQEEVKKETERTNPSNNEKRQELSKRQQDLKQNLEVLQKELGELEKKMQEFPNEMPLEELRRAMEGIAKQQVGQKMEMSAQHLQSGEMQQAQQQQQDIASALEQLQKQLEQAQQAMLQKQQQQVLRDLKETLQNLLALSQEQEALKNESQKLEPNSQRFRENAQQQMSVMDELMELIDSMQKLSQRTLVINRETGKAVGKALAEMNEAMNGLESRNGSIASQHQGAAMGALNEAAVNVLSALQAMMQGGGGAGFPSLLEQLQRMIGQQQGINAGTMNLGQLNSLTPEQQAEIARLAGQQAAVQKSLEQLNEEAKQSAERERILGDLSKISEEMKEVVKDLEQKDINPNTIRKQERILSRLLDAQRSMRERDFEKRRKAEAGQDVVRASPKELDLTTQEGKNRLMQDLLKAMEEGYAKDYQDLIRKYFEALQKLEVEHPQDN
jgi:hypothetical protein